MVFRRFCPHLCLLLALILSISSSGALFRTPEEKAQWMAERHGEAQEHIHRALERNDTSASSGDIVVKIVVHYRDECPNPYHDFKLTNAHPMTVSEKEYQYMLENMDAMCIQLIELNGVVFRATFVTGANNELDSRFHVMETEVEPWGGPAVLGNFPPAGLKAQKRVTIAICDSGLLVDHLDLVRDILCNGSIVKSVDLVEDGLTLPLPSATVASRTGYGRVIRPLQEMGCPNFFLGSWHSSCRCNVCC